MKIQLYDKLTLLCMATAVTSAVLFDRIEPYGWVAAVLGIGSASASILMYLCLRDRETDQEFSKTETGPRDVALNGNLSRAPALPTEAVWPNAYDGSYPANAHLEVSAVDSPANVVAATDIESAKRQMALDVRASLYVVDRDQWAGSAWVIMEVGSAGEPEARVHVKRHKRTFDTLEEARFGRISSDALWISVLMATEVAGSSRRFRKESRRLKSFPSPEALLVLPNLKEQLHH